jgi:hypothetical protein
MAVGSVINEPSDEAIFRIESHRADGVPGPMLAGKRRHLSAIPNAGWVAANATMTTTDSGSLKLTCLPMYPTTAPPTLDQVVAPTNNTYQGQKSKPNSTFNRV